VLFDLTSYQGYPLATPAKKSRRRALRRGRIDLLCSEASPILLDSEALIVNIEAAPVIEAEDDDDDAPKSPPKFKCKAYDGSAMRPRVRMYDTGGAPTVIDMTGVKVHRNGRKMPVLYAHDRNDPIGHTDRVDLLATDITAEGVLSVPGKSRDKVAGGAQDGFQWAVSIGFEATELEYISSSDSATVNGRVMRGPLYIARRGMLREISFLSIGADASATATVSATLAPLEPQAMPPELRSFIEAAGFNPDEISDAQIDFFRKQQAATVEASHDEEIVKPVTKPVIEAGADDHIANLRKQAAVELSRQNRIVEICAEYGNPSITIQGSKKALQVVAVEAGWDEARTELEALRASRPAAPAIHSTGKSSTHTIEAVTAGLMMRAGVNVESSHFQGMAAIEAGAPEFLTAGVNSERFQRAAEAGRRFREATLLEICATAVEIETGNRPHGKRATIEAAFSSASVANLFGTTIGARVLMQFREANDTTAGWTSRATVPDFEEHDRVGLDSMEAMDYLPPGGEAGHAKRSDKNETVQAARYAKQYQIDEQDLIGDRLGLLATTPMAMGRAAGRLIPDLVYGLLLANPTMARTGRAAFHTTDGTLLTGAALESASLSTAIASLMKQTDNGATLNLQPTHLLTGAELADAAIQLLGSPVLSNDSGRGANNPIARYGIQLVADARLSNGVIHPKTKVLQTGSSTAWFLVSTQGDTIEIQTVEGTGAVPVVRVSNLTQGKFGMHVDCKFDVGAKILENRTMRKNAGA
jgi:hypothetical protein